MAGFRVGVDIGGTFTDIVFLGQDGTIYTKKVSSSVDNYARAITDGLSQVFQEAGHQGGSIEEVLHATTVASNAILELKGARTGLITTKGFRDILEIRHSSLYAPRDFDISPYFALVKPTIERGFDYRCMAWAHLPHTHEAAPVAPDSREIEAEAEPQTPLVAA